MRRNANQPSILDFPIEPAEKPGPMRAVFDPKRGEALKDAGMALAAEHHSSCLDLARKIAVKVALSRPDRTAFIDDVWPGLLAAGYTDKDLGNAAGSVFRGWIFTGEYRASERATNHGHESKVWRLK